MTKPEKAIVSWSSGKDCAFALHRAQQTGAYSVVGALTTITTAFGRVSMHGVREELLDRQASALGLPLTKIGIPSPCPDDVYNAVMAEAMEHVAADGVRHVIFGDLFLEDVRAYRVERLAEIGLTGVFPLWGHDTTELAREILAAGIEAWVTCVDPKQLAPSFAGRRYDQAFIEDLPKGVDACGENGEFHTVVTAAPHFRQSIAVRPGKIVERDGFVFADIVPA